MIPLAYGVLDISADGSRIMSRDGVYESGVFKPRPVPDNGMSFWATAMSDDGKVVIGSNTANSYKVWTEQDGFLAQYNEVYADVSANGRYLIKNRKMIDLVAGATIQIDLERALSVTSDGVVVGQQGDFATLWRNGDSVALGRLNQAGVSTAYAVTENGKIVVGLATSNDAPETRAYQNNPASWSIPEAFIWDEVHGMRSVEKLLTNEYGVDLNGWRLANATVISADGTHIAGVGIDAEGTLGRWMVRLVDECSELSW